MTRRQVQEPPWLSQAEGALGTWQDTDQRDLDPIPHIAGEQGAIEGPCGRWEAGDLQWPASYHEDALPAREDSDGQGGALAKRNKPGVVARTNEGQRQSDPVASSAAKPSRFVEHLMPGERRSITIELAGATGDHLRVEVRGDFDVTALVQRVWNRAS